MHASEVVAPDREWARLAVSDLHRRKLSVLLHVRGRLDRAPRRPHHCRIRRILRQHIVAVHQFALLLPFQLINQIDLHSAAHRPLLLRILLHHLLEIDELPLPPRRKRLQNVLRALDAASPAAPRTKLFAPGPAREAGGLLV